MAKYCRRCRGVGKICKGQRCQYCGHRREVTCPSCHGTGHAPEAPQAGDGQECWRDPEEGAGHEGGR